MTCDLTREEIMMLLDACQIMHEVEQDSDDDGYPDWSARVRRWPLIGGKLRSLRDAMDREVRR
jgi:hypothetical protein